MSLINSVNRSVPGAHQERTREREREREVRYRILGTIEPTPRLNAERTLKISKLLETGKSFPATYCFFYDGKLVDVLSLNQVDAVSYFFQKWITRHRLFHCCMIKAYK